MRCKISSLFIYCCISLCVANEPQNVTFFVRESGDSNRYIARRGTLVLRPGSPAVVLLLHGYGVDKYDVAPFRLLLRKYTTLTFDFRAHGEVNHSQLSTLGHDEVYDIFGAIDYIRSLPELAQKPIVVVGFSMGAATAIEAQAIDATLFSGMFLDTPFSSSSEVIKRGMDAARFEVWGKKFDVPGRTLLESNAFHPYVQPLLRFIVRLKTGMNADKVATTAKPIEPVESIKKINIPVFLVVSKQDDKVSEEHLTKLYHNHQGYTRLWVADGRHHCDAVFKNPERYEHILNMFITSVLSGEIAKQNQKEIIRDP